MNSGVQATSIAAAGIVIKKLKGLCIANLYRVLLAFVLEHFRKNSKAISKAGLYLSGKCLLLLKLLSARLSIKTLHYSGYS